MTDLFFARGQMAMSLAFHIVFAALGIGMPLLMAFAAGKVELVLFFEPSPTVLASDG